MSPTYGSHLWVPPMGPTYASHLRVTPMGPTYGSHLWVPPMYPTYRSHLGVALKGPTYCRHLWAPLLDSTRTPQLGAPLIWPTYGRRCRWRPQIAWYHRRQHFCVAPLGPALTPYLRALPRRLPSTTGPRRSAHQQVLPVDFQEGTQ